MAEDPVNQAQFMEDVAASAAAGGPEGFKDLGDPQGSFEMPSVDEVWKIIEQMEGISDEEKANLKDSLFNPKELGKEEFLNRLATAAQPEMGHTSWDYIIFFTMITILLLIFALFGYKLYKSLMEKEQKKQEKLKLKQSKKSKKVN